jgi:hypothetical protein
MSDQAAGITSMEGIGQTVPWGRELRPEVRRRARRLAWIYLFAAAWLILWTVYLALSLPGKS